MINIKFYNCTDENEVVHKNLTGETSKNGYMVNTDVLNPILKVESNVLGKTYCYIEHFSRYYFISHIEMLDGKHCLVYCRIDVLMTYKGELENLEGLIARNEDKTKMDKMLPDTCMPISSNRLIYTKDLGISLYDESNVTYLIGIK